MVGLSWEHDRCHDLRVKESLLGGILSVCYHLVHSLLRTHILLLAFPFIGSVLLSLRGNCEGMIVMMCAGYGF